MKITQIINSKELDITRIVSSVTWGGDDQQAARTLSFGIASSPTDTLLPTVNLKNGGCIIFYGDSGKERFRGYIFGRDKSTSNSEITRNAYDGLIYLTKNKATYNFKRITPEAIMRKIADDFNIPLGEVAQTGISIKLIADALSLYEILTQAYETASKQNGKKYIFLMQKGLLNVIEKGSVIVDTILSDATNISDSSYSDSIENVINRVKIYTDTGSLIGEISNQEWIDSFGLMQEIYKKEENVDPKIAAKNMLAGEERSANFTATGNEECITGRAVFIEEPYSGLIGLFYIISDSHTWQDGNYTMQLTVDLKDIIDKSTMITLVSRAKAAAKLV